MSARTKKPQRERICPYIPADLRREVLVTCVRLKVTESAYVTMALRQAIDGTGDGTILLQRLDRLGRGLERVQRSVDFMGEVLTGYLRSWFAHTPTVAPNDEVRRAQARASGETRFRELMEYVRRQFVKGGRFVEQLPIEPLADPAEPDAVRTQQKVGGPAEEVQ